MQYRDIIKKVLFWCIYTMLAGLFSLFIFHLTLEEYYIWTDYAYWRRNYTPFPPFEIAEPPSVEEYFNVTFCLLLLLVPYIYDIYLIFKKQNKRRGLIFFVSVLIVFYLYNIFRCQYFSYCG